MRSRDAEFRRGLARAGAGALIFAVPMLMTMELWHMGSYLPPRSLLILVIANIPFLVGLSHYAGFEETSSWSQELLDTFVAYAVGILIAMTVLAMLAMFGGGVAFREMIGKLVLQAVPASMGASLAQSQLGLRDQRDVAKRREAGYFGELFIMAAGALYLAFNVAPTEEVLQLSLRISPVLGFVLALVSIGILYVFVYSVSFRGQEVPPEGTSRVELLFHYVVGGHAIVWCAAALVLLLFGRLSGLSFFSATMIVTVLAFPCSVGAAAARLVI